MGGVRQSLLLGIPIAGLSTLAVLSGWNEAARRSALELSLVGFSICLLLIALRFRNLRVVLASTLFLMVAVLSRAISLDGGIVPWLATLAAVNLAFISSVDDPSFDFEVLGLWTAWLVVQGGVLAGLQLTHPEKFAVLRLQTTFGFGMSIHGILFTIAALILLANAMVKRDPVVAGLLWAAAPMLFLLFSPRALTLSLIAVVALAIALMERSYWIAYFDELTGLRGRRALNEAFQALGDDYCIAIVDVDHFKSFNDTYGHDVGDQVLRKVGAQLARVGGGGHAFRCGGEEFVLLFRGKPAEHAVRFAEKVRQAIEADVFYVRGQDRSKRPRDERRRLYRPSRQKDTEACTVTVSIGVAEAPEGFRPEQVYKAADRALYRAKHAGRNRVELARRAASAPRRFAEENA
ncbi:MAG TPA: GGDEF domain-containing protein [Terriglobales bacterium]|nr:GGDEF domain-containing protein [Terriglobales bacterium]